jgi:DNA-binding transcriptional LysR family regulator
MTSAHLETLPLRGRARAGDLGIIKLMDREPSLNHVVIVSLFATMLAFVRAGAGLAIVSRIGVESFLGKELVAAAGLVALVQRSWGRAA